VEYSSEEEGDRFMKGDGNAAQRYPQMDPQRVPTNEPFSLSPSSWFFQFPMEPKQMLRRYLVALFVIQISQKNNSEVR
jgi:hypothetical protein